jgi:site-specific DNA-cytosine methylase
LKALDLFCGLGGWSDGLALEGFEVLGVEINQEIADLYKHPVICEDVRNLNPLDFAGYDLIVGSPPCRDFTRLPDHAVRSDGTIWKWKNPKNPEKGMELVNAFLRMVEEASPHYWLMENVPGLTKHLDLKPRCKAYLGKSMQRCFWGTYPAFLIPVDLMKRKIWDIQGRYRAWERARMPLPVARALGKAVSDALEPN